MTSRRFRTEGVGRLGECLVLDRLGRVMDRTGLDFERGEFLPADLLLLLLSRLLLEGQLEVVLLLEQMRG